MRKSNSDNTSIKKALNDFKGTCKTVIGKGKSNQGKGSKSNVGATSEKHFKNPVK